MKKIFFISAILLLTLSACKDTKPDVQQEKSTVKLDQTGQENSAELASPEKIESTEAEPKIEIKGNIYTEYYPGTNRIKFQGPQDKDGKRDGKWMFFNEKGIELSMTTYKNGKKHGPTMVKYPNGNIHYTGEYTNDKTTGIWTTYSEFGEKLTVKNFDELN